MGKDPVKAGAFREYLRVLRALLHGEEVDYALGDGAQAGERTDIRFLHPDAGFIDVTHPVPIYVAADGPLALRRPAPTATAASARTTRPRRACRKAWK